MKNLKFLFPALCLSAMLMACSDDDDNTTLPPPPAPTPSAKALVLNQGAQYYGISGTMDCLDLQTNQYVKSVFSQVNQQALGDNPIDGVEHGSKIYVAMYASDLVWVINSNTLKIEQVIPTNDPEGICAKDGFVYVSNNDGNVSRIDTLTLTVDKKIEVGPNPAHLTVSGDYLYVSISDGYNYENNYANGKKVAKVSLADFTKTADIPVGLNPGPICASADGSLFVVARGNYADILPTVYRIGADGIAKEYCQASHIAMKGNCLYTIYNYTDWAAEIPTTTLRFDCYNIATGERQENILDAENLPVAPIDIDVDPTSGDIYIGSNASAYDYTSEGFVYRYAADGSFKERYSAGVAPCAVIFSTKK